MSFPFVPVLLGAGIAGNIASTIMTNNSNQDLANQSYRQQLDMFNRQNEYNTPENQMKRFQQAGLNPNLIYGQGNAGNSPVITPKYEPARNVAPQVELNQLLLALDARQKAAQIQQVEAQTRYTEMRTATEGISQNLKNQALQGSIFDLDQKKGLAPYVQSIKQYQNTEMANKVDMLMQKIALAKQEQSLKSQELMNQKTKGLNLKLQTEGMSLDNKMKAYQQELRKFGLNEGDNVILRGLLKNLQKVDFIKNLLDF